MLVDVEISAPNVYLLLFTHSSVSRRINILWCKTMFFGRQCIFCMSCIGGFLSLLGRGYGATIQPRTSCEDLSRELCEQLGIFTKEVAPSLPCWATTGLVVVRLRKFWQFADQVTESLPRFRPWHGKHQAEGWKQLVNVILDKKEFRKFYFDCSVLILFKPKRSKVIKELFRKTLQTRRFLDWWLGQSSVRYGGPTGRDSTFSIKLFLFQTKNDTDWGYH